MIVATLVTSKDYQGRVRALQRKLYLKAKQQSKFRFYSLYDKIYRSDVLWHAYDLVRRNNGSAGLDGETIASIEAGIGRDIYLQEIQEALKAKTYQATPVKRVEIPSRTEKSVRWEYLVSKIA